MQNNAAAIDGLQRVISDLNMMKKGTKRAVDLSLVCGPSKVLFKTTSVGHDENPINSTHNQYLNMEISAFFCSSSENPSISIADMASTNFIDYVHSLSSGRMERSLDQRESFSASIYKVIHRLRSEVFGRFDIDNYYIRYLIDITQLGNVVNTNPLAKHSHMVTKSEAEAYLKDPSFAEKSHSVKEGDRVLLVTEKISKVKAFF